MSIVNKLPQRTLHKSLITPVDNDGTAITSTIIDRLGYQSMSVNLNWAAASGSPDAATTAIKVYSNSASSSSSPTPVELVALETALDIDAAAGNKQWDIDLSNAKRYVYITVDTTYTGGTSPKNILSAVAVFGDKDTQPANSGSVYGR